LAIDDNYLSKRVDTIFLMKPSLLREESGTSRNNLEIY